MRGGRGGRGAYRGAGSPNDVSKYQGGRGTNGEYASVPYGLQQEQPNSRYQTTVQDDWSHQQQYSQEEVVRPGQGHGGQIDAVDSFSGAYGGATVPRQGSSRYGAGASSTAGGGVGVSLSLQQQQQKQAIPSQGQRDGGVYGTPQYQASNPSAHQQQQQQYARYQGAAAAQGVGKSGQQQHGQQQQTYGENTYGSRVLRTAANVAPTVSNSTNSVATAASYGGLERANSLLRSLHQQPQSQSQSQPSIQTSQSRYGAANQAQGSSSLRSAAAPQQYEAAINQILNSVQSQVSSSGGAAQSGAGYNHSAQGLGPRTAGAAVPAQSTGSVYGRPQQQQQQQVVGVRQNQSQSQGVPGAGRQVVPTSQSQQQFVSAYKGSVSDAYYDDVPQQQSQVQHQQQQQQQLQSRSLYGSQRSVPGAGASAAGAGGVLLAAAKGGFQVYGRGQGPGSQGAGGNQGLGSAAYYDSTTTAVPAGAGRRGMSSASTVSGGAIAETPYRDVRAVRDVRDGAVPVGVRDVRDVRYQNRETGTMVEYFDDGYDSLPPQQQQQQRQPQRGQQQQRAIPAVSGGSVSVSVRQQYQQQQQGGGGGGIDDHDIVPGRGGGNQQLQQRQAAVYAQTRGAGNLLEQQQQYDDEFPINSGRGNQHYLVARSSNAGLSNVPDSYQSSSAYSHGGGQQQQQATLLRDNERSFDRQLQQQQPRSAGVRRPAAGGFINQDHLLMQQGGGGGGFQPEFDDNDYGLGPGTMARSNVLIARGVVHGHMAGQQQQQQQQRVVPLVSKWAASSAGFQTPNNIVAALQVKSVAAAVAATQALAAAGMRSTAYTNTLVGRAGGPRNARGEVIGGGGGGGGGPYAAASRGRGAPVVSAKTHPIVSSKTHPNAYGPPGNNGNNSYRGSGDARSSRSHSRSRSPMDGRGYRGGERGGGGTKRLRSRSRSSSRSRSLSRSDKKQPSRRQARSPGRTAPNKSQQQAIQPAESSSSSSAITRVDYAGMTLVKLTETFNTPAVGRSCRKLFSNDLYTRYPNLYVPADFVSIDIDWVGGVSDAIKGIHVHVPVLFENSPSALIALPTASTTIPSDLCDTTTGAEVGTSSAAAAETTQSDSSVAELSAEAAASEFDALAGILSDAAEDVTAAVATKTTSKQQEVGGAEKAPDVVGNLVESTAEAASSESVAGAVAVAVVGGGTVVVGAQVVSVSSAGDAGSSAENAIEIDFDHGEEQAQHEKIVADVGGGGGDEDTNKVQGDGEGEEEEEEEVKMEVEGEVDGEEEVKMVVEGEQVGAAIDNEQQQEEEQSLIASETAATLAATAAAAANPPQAQVPAALELCKFTYVTPTYFEDDFAAAGRPQPKPIKFNARIILSLGYKENELDRVDFNLPRKLRVLCGRRKGKITLLGGSWCKELDGGDPLEDRSCLINTARRTVMAQSLFDIFDGQGDSGENSIEDVGMYFSTNIVKLGEINYQRPEEEINGKFYPEQDEVSVLFACIIQPRVFETGYVPDHSLPGGFDERWHTYLARTVGISVGPTLNLPHHAALQASADAADAVVAAMEVSPDILGTANTATGVAGAETAGANQVTNTSTVATAVTVSTTASTPAGATTPVSLAKTLSSKEKPSKPTVLLCPMPLPSELVVNAAKRQEAVSLKFLTLSALLSYDLDDSNERIFEASVAAELLKNFFAVAYATAIADFILAEHEILYTAADERIVRACKRLREMNSKINQRTKSDAAARLKVIEQQRGELIKGLKDAAATATTATSVATATSATTATTTATTAAAAAALAATSAATTAPALADVASSTIAAAAAAAITTSDSVPVDNHTSSAGTTVTVVTDTDTVSAEVKVQEETQQIVAPADSADASTAADAITAASAATSGDAEAPEAASTIGVKRPLEESAEGESNLTEVKREKIDHEESENQAQENLIGGENDLTDPAQDNLQTAVEEHNGQQVDGPEDPTATAAAALQHSAESSSSSQQEEADKADEKVEAVEEEVVEEVEEVVEDMMMDEDEARSWRRYFVSACRWFDQGQDKFLRADHLQLILLSSIREVSRSDLESAIKRACKDDRIRYETYI